MAKIRIYFAQNPKDEKEYEIYREGKPTGETGSIRMIRKLLTKEQYRLFILEGQTIFQIEGEKFRTRNHKPKKRKLTGRSPDNFNFTKLDDNANNRTHRITP